MNRWVSANHAAAAARQGRWTAIKTWSICVGGEETHFLTIIMRTQSPEIRLNK